MKYRMLVSDFDGTLLRSDHTVSKSTVDAIDEFISKGGRFIVCTGRMARSIAPHLRDYGMKGDVLCCQGSVLCDIESGRIKMDEGIPADEAYRVFTELEKEGEHLQFYYKDEMITNVLDEYTEVYMRVCKVSAKIVEGKLSDYVKNNAISKVNKIMVMGPSERMRELWYKYRDYFGKEISVNMGADNLLEVVSSEFTKGRAIERIAEAYGIRIDEVIAVGDSLNDYTMMEHCGLGVAVGNADPLLKERADLVTLTNDENAVEYLIREYCLKGE